MLARLVTGALVGAVNGLNLMNVSIYYQLIVIVIAVEADVLRAHLEARFRVQQAERAA